MATSQKPSAAFTRMVFDMANDGYDNMPKDCEGNQNNEPFSIFDDRELLSNCCYEPAGEYELMEICPHCFEHCTGIIEEEEDFIPSFQHEPFSAGEIFVCLLLILFLIVIFGGKF